MFAKFRNKVFTKEYLLKKIVFAFELISEKRGKEKLYTAIGSRE